MPFGSYLTGTPLGSETMQMDELRARRLIAQRLAPTRALEPLTSPLAAADWMTAVQGQNYSAGLRALALRADAADGDVEGQVDRLSIVRCWPQRGTLHFVPAVDARWLMQLGHPRVERAAAGRRAGLGLTPEHVETAGQALHDALRHSDEPLTRTEIYGIFSAAGVDPAKGRGPHLIRALGGEGEVVQTSKQGRHERFVHVDKLPLPHFVPGDPAEESARRYVLSRGPVTVADFAWWSGQTVRESRRALVRVADDDEVAVDGDYLYGAFQAHITDAEIQAALDAVLHLPAFDEYLLAYADKSFALAEDLRPRVLTRNGISWPFVVKNGVVAGREGD